jgi:hypothetical protein
LLPGPARSCVVGLVELGCGALWCGRCAVGSGRVVRAGGWAWAGLGDAVGVGSTVTRVHRDAAGEAVLHLRGFVIRLPSPTPTP